MCEKMNYSELAFPSGEGAPQGRMSWDVSSYGSHTSQVAPHPSALRAATFPRGEGLISQNGVIMMNLSNLSLLVIAGGQSTRLGRDKRQLQLGDKSLLEITLAKGRDAGFTEIFLCAEAPSPFLTELAEEYGATLLLDEKQNFGPVSGLAKGLSSISKPWALTMAGDMPFLDLEELCRWGATLPTSELALVPVTQGRLQPLAAFYRRETATYFQKALHDNIGKIRQVLEAFPCNKGEYTGSPSHFFNLNTPADWRLAQGRFANLQRRVPIISITAPASGTGKTTFIEKLLPRLRKRGIRTGVIKSDSHGFNLDMEGKDSCRFSEAGAESVAVISPQGWFITQKTAQRADFEAVASKMEGIDLLLTESRSHGTLPTLSLWRGKGTPLAGEDVAAIFTSEPHAEAAAIYEYNLNDIEKAVELCLFLMGR